MILASASCGDRTSDTTGNNTLPIEVDSVSVKDSITDQSGIKITSSVSIVFPSKFMQSKSQTENLAILINNAVFNAKEADFNKMAQSVVDDRLASYSLTQSNIDESQEDETAPISRYDIRQAVGIAYHNFDLLCLEKKSATSKDCKLSLSSCSFYTFDLIGKKRISLSDIFSDSDIPQINDLIKNELLGKEKCSNTDQLADLGYFNADNLSATENFSLSDDGITFHYNPLEIACYAVGPVDIRIPFSDIEQYISEQSPLKRITK